MRWLCARDVPLLLSSLSVALLVRLFTCLIGELHSQLERVKKLEETSGQGIAGREQLATRLDWQLGKGGRLSGSAFIARSGRLP